jgi:hypothetical protein
LIYLSTKLVKLKIVFLREKLEHFDYFRTDGLAIINYWKKKAIPHASRHTMQHRKFNHCSSWWKQDIEVHKVKV